MKPEQPATPTPLEHAGLGRLSPVWQWCLLAALSVVFAAVLEAAGIPAGLLMGPMLAGAVIGMNGGTIRLPRQLVFCVQFVLAMMIAASMSPALLVTFSGNWPLFLAVILSVIGVSTLSGWIITRMRILPGTTAIWGSSAGAASTMLLMADAYGADARLVAFMQYLRVVFVASAATMIAHLWVSGAEAETPTRWFAPIAGLPFLATLAVGILGGFLGKVLRVPAGAFLVPFAIGSALNITGALTIELPQWLLALSFAMLGWNIGLGFTRTILTHARRALVPTVISILVLMSFSGLLALLLIKAAGIDPLTAYLATSPGGLDSIAVIAASSNVDLSFVMALQTARLLIITLIGPALARFVADRV
ncbi:AbrB family transcriptional regulator [Sinorhizobium numidicum]|uniref:AbrB family transcriptional regulator n=1 Tax=Sinorhizobium numidicum TaxID=680248 RepID=A0ABY8CWA6_9HYPH|nr:AbrB family transcriptional regulator [Sinorhizobium numidicum]WEX76265.1 AbrB family transcriptional regulator [Sinorhizobium numidicum]WEX82925.1 AbrB family transcriptional regulator [Sinorhizobium numidicum]